MQFVPFNRKYNRKNFDCGIETLNKFLQEQAGQHDESGMSKTTLLVDGENQIMGYYCLTVGSVNTSLLPIEDAKGLPKNANLPVIRIGRLAVDKAYHKKGHGKRLLINALKKCYDHAHFVGIVAVVVDAKHTAQDFYIKYGFKQFNFIETLPTVYLPFYLKRSVLLKLFNP